MATNLRNKIPSTDSILIHDVNKEVTSSFAAEHKGVEIAENVREVAERSVRQNPFAYNPLIHTMMSILFYL